MNFTTYRVTAAAEASLWLAIERSRRRLVGSTTAL